MKLLVLHPQLSQRTCDACRRWVFDDRHQRLTRRGQPVPRPAEVPTPCETCPKQNPVDGAYFDRHVSDFAWLIRRRYEAIGTGGACFSPAERADRVLHRNLGIVEAVLRQCEVEQIARHVQKSLMRTGVPR
ncbi:MAG TPA: hypothetical protein VHY20_01885 [Pirellulales bacterium]|nr:hypothetical protein [Pirellulales bacterium]